MKHFELGSGQSIVMSLSGSGVVALQVTVSGHVGANAPTMLLNERVRAAGNKPVAFEHAFAPGQLDAYEQLQIDPVVYGRAGEAYELTLTLRQRSDASATFSETLTGKLVSSRGSSDITESGFDAPLFLVEIRAEPKSFDLDEGADLGAADLSELLGNTLGAGSDAVAGLGRGGGGLAGLGNLSGGGLGAGPETKQGRRRTEAAPVVAEVKADDIELAPPSPESDDGTKHYPVWYGTNRAPVLKDGKVIGYSPYRDEGAVHFGRCIVRVPESHVIGTTGSSLIKRIAKGSDDRLKIEELIEIEQKLYWTSIAKQIAAAPIEKRDAVVFIHGYNVSFSDAAIRAAQLGCDLSIDGAMSFYSWPSRGTLEGYPADEATVQASAIHITDFLTKIAVRSKAKNVHVIAHSMGNRATLEAVREIVGAAGKKAKRRFSQFILAAPDIDAEYFKQFAEQYSQVAKRTTMYVSDHDRAVAASKFLHGGVARVGLAPPVQIIAGLDTVYAGYVDDSFMGHGYVAEAWQLLNDIHQLIHFDAPPTKRSWVRKAKGGNYWELVGRV